MRSDPTLYGHSQQTVERDTITIQEIMTFAKDYSVAFILPIVLALIAGYYANKRKKKK